MNIYDRLKKKGICLEPHEVENICVDFQICELSIFGSALRDDFNESSDVDILVSYHADSKGTLLDLVRLKDVFSQLLNRDVDIVEKEALRNPFRKKKILSTSEVIYANQWTRFVLFIPELVKELSKIEEFKIKN